MSLIRFQNNSAPYINDENLNHNFDELKSYSLYSNSNGSTGDITLSDSSTNYHELRILYGTDDGIYNVAVISNFPRKTSLSLDYWNAGINAFQHFAGTIEINGTTITHTTDYYYINSGGVVTQPTNTNYIKIYEVVGYK